MNCLPTVLLQEAVLGLKMPSPITVLLEKERGLGSAVASRVVPTLWKRADQKKKDKYSGKRRQLQADVSLVDVTH